MTLQTPAEAVAAWRALMARIEDESGEGALQDHPAFARLAALDEAAIEAPAVTVRDALAEARHLAWAMTPDASFEARLAASLVNDLARLAGEEGA